MFVGDGPFETCGLNDRRRGVNEYVLTYGPTEDG